MVGGLEDSVRQSGCEQQQQQQQLKMMVMVMRKRRWKRKRNVELFVKRTYQNCERKLVCCQKR